ncbi:uncharacterized protein LOC126318671 [Schistocerca gregaria]|uniref:uncharacterized protein LOC126318671 n=1 Tax=Schistocerca gregaria TaxID=7010 RepID=UPI00211E8C19|nr:uncharacterized protein LOC126318671 [Schistocerca gregaria]
MSQQKHLGQWVVRSARSDSNEGSAASTGNRCLSHPDPAKFPASLNGGKSFKSTDSARTSTAGSDGRGKGKINEQQCSQKDGGGHGPQRNGRGKSPGSRQLKGAQPPLSSPGVSGADAEESERQRALEEAIKREEAVKRAAEEDRLALEEQERQKKEQEKKAKAEEERRMIEEQTLRYISERRRALLLKELRKSNLQIEASRPDPSYFRGLNSSISKNTSFVRKLSTSLCDSHKEALIRELRTLNLTKYVSEAVSNLLNASVRAADINTFVQVCSEFHRLYADFSSEIVSALIKRLPFEKSPFSRRKQAVWQLVYLFVTGVYSDESVLGAVVREIFEPKGQKCVTTLQLALCFVKAGGREILRVVPYSQESRVRCLREFYEKRRRGEKDEVGPLSIVLKEEEVDELLSVGDAPVCGESIVSESLYESLVSQFNAYYEKVLRMLFMDQRDLQKLELTNRRTLKTRLELPQEARDEYARLQEQFDVFFKTAKAFADFLGKELPELPQEEFADKSKGKQSSEYAFSEAGVDRDAIWGDQETYEFYNVIPDLKELTSSSAAAAKPPAAECDASGLAAAPDASPSKDAEQSVSSSVLSSKNFQMFICRLSTCSDQESIDKAAVDFYQLSQKPWRLKMAQFLFNSPRNRLNILKYYSRFVAILNPFFREIKDWLLKKLEEEFETHFKQKDQMNIQTKIKNIHFLSELVKFRLCPVGTILNFLKMCLDDFHHHNVDVVCEMLETCGRFLYCSPEYHAHMRNLLELIVSIKNARAFPVRVEMMIRNAIAACKPIERLGRASKVLSPTRQYIQKLLGDLNKDTVETVATQLRKLDWAQNETYLLKQMLDVEKSDYHCLESVCRLLLALYQSYHGDFCVKYIHSLLERLRIHLQEQSNSNHQKLLMYIKVLSELYNLHMVDNPTAFGVLYTLLRYRTFTFGSGNKDMRESQQFFAATAEEITSYARFEDSFRVRLICAFILGSQQTLLVSSPQELNRFMLFFQRYLFLQVYLSRDLKSILDEVFHSIGPHIQVYHFYSDVLFAIDSIQSRDSVPIDVAQSLPYRVCPPFYVGPTICDGPIEPGSRVQTTHAATDDKQTSARHLSKQAEDAIIAQFDQMMAECIGADDFPPSAPTPNRGHPETHATPKGEVVGNEKT